VVLVTASAGAVVGVGDSSSLDSLLAAQILVVRRNGRKFRGSGYRTSADTVLTAAHVVEGAASLRLRFVDRGAVREFDGEIGFLAEDLDIAVVRMAVACQDVPEKPVAVRFGRLDEPAECEALGFPRFKLRKTAAGVEFRDTHLARGRAEPLSNLRARTLELRVAAPEYDRDRDRSPWEGMSGAAVWSGGRIVGMISEHRRAEGLGTLTAVRTDRWHDLPPARLGVLHELIGFPLDPVRLTAVNSRTDLLEQYVAAAGRESLEHPYPGGAPGSGLLVLADLYTGQRLERVRRTGDGPAEGAEEDLLLSDEVVTRGGDCIVSAGPGGGKTCLLRVTFTTLIDAWHRGSAGSELPVLVPAVDLASDELVPATVARCATRHLSRYGLLSVLTPQLFTSPPRPGARWLLLVDGLDEITDPAARRRVLGKLSALSGRVDAPFRFIVASRPLPAAELADLGSTVSRYVLRAFEPGQVRQLADRWFRAEASAAETSTAENRAAAFAAAVARAPVAELARVPLMAVMLCQLYSADSARPLPVGRSEIYARFISLLLDRQRTAGNGGIHAQARAVLERFGEGVLIEARQTIDRLPEVLGYLAAELQVDGSLAVTEVMASHVGASCPRQVPRVVWEEFLGEILRRTGLVGESIDGLGFTHQTIAEYLAAVQIATDSKAASRALEEVLRDWWRECGPDAQVATMVEARVNGYARTSFVGFLIDTLGERSRAKTLDAVVKNRGLEGCELVGHLAQLGTDIPAAVTATATSRLLRLTRRGGADLAFSRQRAAVALVDLGDLRGSAILQATAEDGTEATVLAVAAAKLNEGEISQFFAHLSADSRVYSAMELAKRGDRRGVDLLTEFAQDAGFEAMGRARAAGALADLGESGAAATLFALARDPSLAPVGRALAGRLLGLKFGDKRAVPILAALARNQDVAMHDRVKAAYSLARLGDRRAAGILAAMTEKPRRPAEIKFDSYVRVRAARALAEIGDKRAHRILKALANDPTVSRYYRRRASNTATAMTVWPEAMTNLQRSAADLEELEQMWQRFRFLAPYFRLQNRILLPTLLRRYGQAGRHGKSELQ
jgi:HEAT repeat protein